MIFLPWKGISKTKLIYGHMRVLLSYIYLPTSLFVVPLTQISMYVGKASDPPCKETKTITIAGINQEK